MQKTITFLKHPLSFPALILALNYIYWLLTAPMSLFDDNFSNYVAGLILLGIFILITGLAKFASKNWKLTIGLIILGSPLIFLLTVITISLLNENLHSEKHLLTAIFIVEMLIAASYPLFILISKQTSTNKYTSLALFFAIVPILGASFMYPISFYPQILDEAKFEEYKYYVTLSPNWDGHIFHSFYKCGKIALNCQELYFSYSQSGEIIVDEQSKEVSLLGYNRLLYTDSENPRSYTGTGGQLVNHIYYLSEECNNFNNDKGYYACESYTYTLYRCDLDYKSCKPLPVQYTNYDSRNFLDLIPDEANGEINLYEEYFETNDSILIFTYGEHPRCYVDGCKILE